MKFVDELMAPYDPTGRAKVPFIKYQEFSVRRLNKHWDFDTSSDVDRFKAIAWYLDYYAPVRAPMPAPMSGEQVRWLLEPAEPLLSERALPRIVEYYWRRDLFGVTNPFESRADYIATAFWWCIERAPQMCIEHSVIPDEFITALSAPVPGPNIEVPICEAVHRMMVRDTGTAWVSGSETERLACYLKILFLPNGLNLALYFPEAVMARLGQIEPVSQNLGGLFRIDTSYALEKTRHRVAKAVEYRKAHRCRRWGLVDVLAPSQGLDWTAVEAHPAPQRRNVEPRAVNPARTCLPFPVRVIGPINSQSGLGQATRMSIEALTAVGVQPELIDFYLDNPAPRSLLWRETRTSDEHQFSVNLVHLNAESIPLAAAYLAGSLFERSYNIGYFFWELPKPALCHELALEQLDEAWVSSEFNRDLYARAAHIPVTKTGIAVASLPELEGTDKLEVRREYGLAETATIFMTTFDSYSFIKRKNPAATLEAFIRAFPADEDVALVVKTHNLSKILGEANVASLLERIRTLVAMDTRIKLIDETLPFRELLRLKSACDAYVSLHRSEGWGYGMVEAMQLGKPVIATGFSGNLEFCNEDTSLLVSYEKTFLERNDYIFVRGGDYWAAPNIDEAASHMRRIFGGPAAAAAMGRRAQTYVTEHFSAKAVGERYLTRLKAIANSGFNVPESRAVSR